MTKKTTFKEIREELTREEINNAKNIYAGCKNNDYIKSQIVAFIGSLDKTAADFGVNVQYGENGADTSYTIRLKAAMSYKKAYRTMNNYIDAINRISALYDAYDKRTMETQEKETTKASVYDDMINELFA